MDPRTILFIRWSRPERIGFSASKLRAVGYLPKQFSLVLSFLLWKKKEPRREGSKKTWRSASDGSSLYQVGSLRLIVDMHDNVIKEIVYDPFGGIIEDTNLALRIPLGSAGGLHDRELAFVRFGWRDKSAG